MSKVNVAWTESDSRVWEAIYGNGEIQACDLRCQGCYWDADFIGLTREAALSAAMSSAADDMRRLKKNRRVGYYSAPKKWRFV